MRWLSNRLLDEDDLRIFASEQAELYDERRRTAGARTAGRRRVLERLGLTVRLAWDRISSGRQEPREPRRGEAMRNILRDLRLGFRMLRRSPALAATIVATVGIGLGATTAMLAITRAVLVDPLPYPDADRIVIIRTDAPPVSWSLSVADYRALDEQQTSFDRFAGYSIGFFTINDGRTAERVRGRTITWDYFGVLGVSAEHGRLFNRRDALAGGRLAILGHAYWIERFSADPAIVGRTIRVDGVDRTVVGVLRASTGPLERDCSVYTIADWPAPPRKGPFFLAGIAHIKPGIARAAAVEELHAINRRIFPIWQSSFSDAKATWGAFDLKTRVIGPVGDLLWLVLAGVACVLIIAWTNAANLMLAHSLGRRRELAIRAALGASRGRLLQLQLAEGALLAGSSAVVAAAIAILCLHIVRSYGASYIPRLDEVRLSGVPLRWLAALSLVSGSAMGLLPALRGRHAPIDSTLRASGRSATGGPRARRMRQTLAAAEFVVATPLLIAAALVIASLAHLLHVDVGIDTRNVLTAGVALPSSQYRKPADARAFWGRAFERLRQLPGVEAVSVADSRPPTESAQSDNFDLERHPTPPGEHQPECPWVGVAGGYFRTVGLRLERGRLFDDRDFADDAPPVVIVDRAWASRFFATEEVLGQRFHEGGCTTCPLTTVVGVVGTVKYLGLDQPDEGTVYWPRDSGGDGYFIVRTSDPPSASVPALRQVVHDLDPNLAVSRIATLDDLVSGSTEVPRYVTALIGGFAASALVLSLLGIYGVMSHFVAEHVRDIGVRLALGGEPAAIARMVVRRGLSVVIPGIIAGIVAAFGLTRLMASLLYSVTPTDVSTFVAVPALMLLAALLACVVPALRASRIDPGTILRETT